MYIHFYALTFTYASTDYLPQSLTQPEVTDSETLFA